MSKKFPSLLLAVCFVFSGLILSACMKQAEDTPYFEEFVQEAAEQTPELAYSWTNGGEMIPAEPVNSFTALSTFLEPLSRNGALPGYGGTYITEERQIVICSTRTDQETRDYYQSMVGQGSEPAEMHLQICYALAQCDYSLAELYETYAELEGLDMAFLNGVLPDVRRNRIAVYVSRWNSACDRKLAAAVTHPERCYIVRQPLPDCDVTWLYTFQQWQAAHPWMDLRGDDEDGDWGQYTGTELAAFYTKINNLRDFFPAESWQGELLSRENTQIDGPFGITIYQYREDGTAIVEDWSEAEAFLEDLLRGMRQKIYIFPVTNPQRDPKAQ